MGYSRT